MIYLAFIWHMHQPYYLDLSSGEIDLPWVRLHGIKDYLDMLKILEDFPGIHQTFNLVPSLIEQIQAYINGSQDKFQTLSYKKAHDLTFEEKHFISERFFSAQLSNIISVSPRYLQLYLKKQAKKEFTTQDYLDLQAWFNLAWFDPYFKKNIPELKRLISKARNFSEQDKNIILSKQIEVLKEIIPAYKRLQASGQIEITLSPYYHPILPLLYNTNTAKEANKSLHLPQPVFNYPEDVDAQINQAINLYRQTFGSQPLGMWPSEEAVSEHIIPSIAAAGIKWIVTDEAILFRSIKNKRGPEHLYKPYLLKRKAGDTSIIFRDRNLSDLVGFVYHTWTEQAAAGNLINHLHNIAKGHKGKDCLITIAMDGENAWEYYRNDGWDFLQHLYKSLSIDPEVRCVTVSEYLRDNPPKDNIKRLSAGSWIYGNFNKWIGQEQKNRAWEYLARAREELKNIASQSSTTVDLKQAWRQIYICEGSDWFWWYGDNNADFDRLFRKHLSNFYRFIGRDIPGYLEKPI